VGAGVSLRRVTSALTLLLALASAPVSGADSLVWVIQGARNTLYLAGSVHLLKRDAAQLPADLERAYAKADAVVMEIDLDDLDPMEAGRSLLERGTYPDTTTLKTTLGDAAYARVAAAAEKVGLPMDAVQRFEPWAVALTLVELAYARLAFDPESGVERQLERRARRDRKEILGLETVDQQLGLLDALSPEDQRRFLDRTVEEMDELAAETEELLTAWRAGDAKELAAMLASEYEQFPALYRALVVERNARWIPRIEQLLREDRDYLVVVGVLHLVGDEGLVALADKRGLKTRRLH
jgi:uncharacterized protein